MLTCRVCIFVFLSEKGANKHPIVVKIPIATAIRTGNIIIAFEWATSLRFRFMSVSNLLPKRNLVFLHFVQLRIIGYIPKDLLCDARLSPTPAWFASDISFKVRQIE
jgi:hypothetical protein